MIVDRSELNYTKMCNFVCYIYFLAIAFAFPSDREYNSVIISCSDVARLC